MYIIEEIFIAVIGTLVGIITGISVGKDKKKSINNVHFYVARDADNSLWLFLCKPKRSEKTFMPISSGRIIRSEKYFSDYGLNTKDFENLKFEDEPVEVFLNLE